MKNLHGIVLAGALLGLFATLSCQNQQGGYEKASRKLDKLKAEMTKVKIEKIDLILSHLRDKQQFNGNVLVAEQGKVILKKSYGFSDFRKKTALDTSTVFRIGSITKQFTATLILMLQEIGKLNVQDTLPRFFPGIAYKKVTIHHLLTHTSGIPDYLTYFYADRTPFEMMTYASNRNIINWLQNESPPLNFKPGDKWEYSNTNYILLAVIIEKIVKKSLPKVIKEFIFRPLEMKHSIIHEYTSRKEIPQRAVGFQPDNATPNDDNYLNKLYGDGGMFSTIGDMYQWNNALYTNKLLQPSSVRAMFNPVKLNNGKIQNYSYGWQIKEKGVYFHIGNWLGFKSVILRIPEEKSCLILLTNNSNLQFEQIYQMLFNIMRNRKYKMPE